MKWKTLQSQQELALELLALQLLDAVAQAEQPDELVAVVALLS